MAVYADNIHRGHVGGTQVGIERGFDIDAELVGLETCRYVGVSFRVYVRVDPDGDWSARIVCTGDFVDTVQFGVRLYIKAADARFERALDFINPLANPREHRFARVTACPQHTLQFTRGDNIKSRTQSGHQVQDGQIGVSLDRVADEVRMPLQGVIKRVPMPLYGGA